MKNIHTSKTVKKVTAIIMAVGMMVGGALTVMADTYDIGDGSISVDVRGDDNWHYVNDKADGDNNVIITGHSAGNTVTVDAGASITLEHVESGSGITVEENEESPYGPAITVTDKNNTGEAATITMIDSFIDLADHSDTPGIHVEEGAALNLQVDGYNWIATCDDGDPSGSAPAIQLDDGASVTVSDIGMGGALVLIGSNMIGSANGSDADVEITIKENNDLEIMGLFDPESGSYGIGTGANGGEAYITIEGSPEIIGFNSNYDERLISYDNNGETQLYFLAKPDKFLELEETIQKTFDEVHANKYDTYYQEAIAEGYDAEMANQYAQAKVEDEVNQIMMEKLLSEGIIIRLDGKKKPAASPAAAAAATAAATAAAKQDGMTALNFFCYLVANAGEYNSEIKALEGKTRQETFENFKAYVEKNKLFDTEGLTPDSVLTAGQIAVVLCKVADISVSGEEEALAKLQEKGILKNRKAGSAVPVDIAETAVKQFIKEFLAGK